MSLFSEAFWLATAERAVKTGAQSAAVTLGAEAFNVFTVSWGDVTGIALGAALLSALTSVASSKSGAPGPSLVGERLPRPGQHRRDV